MASSLFLWRRLLLLLPPLSLLPEERLLRNTLFLFFRFPFPPFLGREGESPLSMLAFLYWFLLPLPLSFSRIFARNLSSGPSILRARGKHCLTSSQHPSTFPLSVVLQSLPGGASLQKGVIIPIPVVAVVVVVLVIISGVNVVDASGVVVLDVIESEVGS